jgi:hypothetical protein
MTFPPEALLAQLAHNGVDIFALQCRFERMFPHRLDPTSANDILWFARFAVERRKYLRAIDALERSRLAGVLTGRPMRD